MPKCQHRKGLGKGWAPREDGTMPLDMVSSGAQALMPRRVLKMKRVLTRSWGSSSMGGP
jgi:hypothetical protein